MREKSSGTLQNQIRGNKLYSSVLDCFNQSRRTKGGLYAGLPVALATQIPYNVIMLTCFDLAYT